VDVTGEPRERGITSVEAHGKYDAERRSAVTP
jgi:hypothetical protein